MRTHCQAGDRQLAAQSCCACCGAPLCSAKYAPELSDEEVQAGYKLLDANSDGQVGVGWRVCGPTHVSVASARSTLPLLRSSCRPISGSNLLCVLLRALHVLPPRL